MIEAQREHSNLSNRNRIIDHDRPLLDHTDTEYSHLRLVDDRSARPSAKSTGICDRESPALYLVGFKLLLSRALAEIVDRPRQTKQRLLISASNHRNDQSPIERDRYADVDVFFVDDLIAPHRRVDDGPLLDTLDHRFDDKRHESELDAVARQELALQLVAKLRRLVKIDLHERSHVSRDMAALYHSLRDPAAHHRHRFDLDTVTLGEGLRTGFSVCRRSRWLCRPRRRGRSSRSWSWSLRGRCRGRGFSFRASPAILDKAKDVLLGYSTADASAFDLGYIDPLFFGDLANEGRRTSAPQIIF